MSKVLKLTQPLTKSSKEVLEDAIAQDFDTVIVFGYKNDTISTASSKSIERIQVIGALEAAKIHLWIDAD